MTQVVVPRIRFSGSEVFLYAALGLAPLGLANPASAQAMSARFAIESSQVANAMQRASLPTEGVQVRLAAPVTSSTANAAVAVESIAAMGAHALRLRLSCSDHSQCLPFFAVASFPDAVDTTKLHFAKLTHVATAPGNESAKPLQPSGLASKSDATAPAILRAGAPATLEFEADRIHIRLDVICLQNGTPGSRIRVSSLDHKQVYMAEIVSPTLLKGELAQ